MSDRPSNAPGTKPRQRERVRGPIEPQSVPNKPSDGPPPRVRPALRLEEAQAQTDTPASSERKHGKADTQKPDYLVGKYRPPKEHQFKRGQVNNPKGRPKGSRNTATIVRDELERKIQVKTARGPKTMTMREVLVRQLIERAMKDAKAFEQVFKLEGPQAAVLDAVAAAKENVLDATDEEILAHMQDRAVEIYLRSREQQEDES